MAPPRPRQDGVSAQEPAHAPLLTVVIPAYNEEHRLRSTLVDYASRFADQHVLVALNGCSDGTRPLVESVALDHPNVHFIEIRQRVGKGGALRAASLVCESEYVAFVDADGSTSATECARLFDVLLASTASGVIGSRWIDGSSVQREQPLGRRFAGWCFNAIVNLLFGLEFRDTMCGVKIFRRTDLLAVLPRVETAGLVFDVDLIVQFVRDRKQLLEVPTVWADVGGSKVQVAKSVVKVFASLVRLRLNQSLLSVIVPAFDRIFPTTPIKQRDKLAILIFGWRDVTNPRAGGSEKYLHEVGKIWSAEGHHVELVTAGFRGAPKRETIDGIRVTRVGNLYTVYLCAALHYLRSMRGRFDVIVDSENGVPFFSPLFSLRPKVLLMYHVHRDVFLRQLVWPLSRIFVAIETRLMPLLYRGSMVAAISEDTVEEMRRYGMTDSPLPIAYPGVDAGLEPGTKATEPTICYVGRLAPYKRLDLLLGAMPEILARHPGARLVIAGRGTDADRLSKLAANLGVAGSVEFRGFVSENEKRSIYQSAWVCAVPSAKEGFCLTAIEANACGTPVVGFDVGGLRTAVPDGVGGLLLPEGSDLGLGILALLENDVLRTRLGASAAVHAAQYTWPNTARELMQVVQLATASAGYGLFITESGPLLVGRDQRLAAL
jgi:glycosyltransferase involved in cell wall biosynthesis